MAKNTVKAAPKVIAIANSGVCNNPSGTKPLPEKFFTNFSAKKIEVIDQSSPQKTLEWDWV